MTPTEVSLDEIGPLFRAMRLERGWTQQSVADQASISRPQLVNIEAGRVNASTDSMQRIADVFGVEIRVQLLNKNNTRVTLDPTHGLKRYRSKLVEASRKLGSIKRMVDSLKKESNL